MSKWIIYTDLDGTLLEADTHAYKKSKKAVETLIEKKVPIVFCSPKTRSEQERIQEEPKLNQPFIVESGSAIYIPKNYFNVPFKARTTEHYQVWELGKNAQQVRDAIHKAREKSGADVKGYSDLSDADILKVTGLTEREIERAKDREYSETLLVGDFESEKFENFQKELGKLGYKCIKGNRYYNVVSQQSDKGQAIFVLNKLFEKRYGSIYTVGIGDSIHDESMLKQVNKPFLVKKKDNSWAEMELSNMQKVNGVGPEGWNKVISQIIDELA